MQIKQHHLTYIAQLEIAATPDATSRHQMASPAETLSNRHPTHTKANLMETILRHLASIAGQLEIPPTRDTKVNLYVHQTASFNKQRATIGYSCNT
jgi:hypothetical protein